jgi:AbrB family looped-hinge helix DNA binding protein
LEMFREIVSWQLRRSLNQSADSPDCGNPAAAIAGPIPGVAFATTPPNSARGVSSSLLRQPAAATPDCRAADAGGPQKRCQRNGFHLQSSTVMSIVTLSSNFEVLIPEEIRQSLHLVPGEKLHVMPYDGRVEFIPVRSVQSMRGFLKGMEIDIEREEDRL